MTDINLTRWLLATGVLICLLASFALILFKVRQGGVVSSSSRRLKILETLSLSARHKVFLLSDGTEEHLLLTGPQGDTLLNSKKIKKSQKKDT